MFKIIKNSKISQARIGIITTPHGRIPTPCFMPDATKGLVKNLTSRELEALGVNCLVANAFHLSLHPDLKIIKRRGGWHDFSGWQKPILTDSGGYQVFSLIHKNHAVGRLSARGAVFSSPLDGAKITLTPEQSIKTQFALGVDMMVCLDDCPPNNYSDDKIKIAVERTIKWAKRCRREYDKNIKRLKAKKRGYKAPLLFAVIQGGGDLALRRHCAQELIKIGFAGFGFGARHVDETGKFLRAPLAAVAAAIPEDKIRFGLGIGQPDDIVKSIKMGWDLFDCVIPTREGRHGRLFYLKNKLLAKNFYQTINITNTKFAKDFSPINRSSQFAELRGYSKAYLHYLFKIKEFLALRLASLNNLEFYVKMISEAKILINNNKL